MILLIAGAVLALIGVSLNFSHFAHAWLVSFMFYLSICLGAFFVVLLHYLFDSYWIVSIRRVAEHLACLLPLMVVLFVPIAIWSGMEFVKPEKDAVHHQAKQEQKVDEVTEKAASVTGNEASKPKNDTLEDAHSQAGEHAFYQWMQSEKEFNKTDKTHDHAWYAKKGYLSKGFWTVRWILCFAIWGFFTWMLRKYSLEQDKPGSADCTRKCRVLAAVGIFVFAATLTIAAIDWMKGLEHQWFSTMYGVYYFAGSVWTSLITIYIITLFLKKTGPL